jgi:hypothetical protein
MISNEFFKKLTALPLLFAMLTSQSAANEIVLTCHGSLLCGLKHTLQNPYEPRKCNTMKNTQVTLKLNTTSSLITFDGLIPFNGNYGVISGLLQGDDELKILQVFSLER